SRSAFHRAYRSTDPPSRSPVAQSCAKDRHNVEAGAHSLPACTMVRETSQNAHKSKGEVPVPHVDEEIASQPACWSLAVDLAARAAGGRRRAAAVRGRALGGTDPVRDEHAGPAAVASG